MGDGEGYVGLEGDVVSAPVGGVFAGAGEGGAAEDEGAFVGPDVTEAVVCCVEDFVAVRVVYVGFLDAIYLRGVGGDGLDG